MILLTLVPIVHLFIVWWLFKGIDQSSDNISDKDKSKYFNFDWGFPIFLSFLFLSSIVYSLITNDNSSSNLIESPAKSEKKSKSTNISQPSISQSSKYSGSHSGSCTSYEAKSFAVKRIESTIGNLMFLDLHRDLGSKWLFYGSAYSSRYQRDVTVWVLINCNNGTYDVENVEIDA